MTQFCRCAIKKQMNDMLNLRDSAVPSIKSYHFHVWFFSFTDFSYALQLASSSLLRLGQETDKEAIKNRESVYLLLDEVCHV